MYLLTEDLTRAHQAARLGEAQELRRGHQLARARRLNRKAERSAKQSLRLSRKAEGAAKTARLTLARAL